MIRREHFCNKLRTLGYTYKRESDRVYMWKKPGNPSYVTVPRSDLLEETYVRATLKLAGCAADEIERFIAAQRVSAAH